TTPTELLTALDALARGELPHGAATGHATGGRTAFLFPGQGSQRPGMGHELAAAHPRFAEALDEICAHLDPALERPLRDVMFAAEGTPEAALLDRTGFAQPALFAIEVALFRLLASWGFRPDVLLGHSVGEIAAAHVAGALSLPDAAALVAARGGLMQALPPGGGMLAVEATEEEMRAALADADDELGIAAVNGPRAVVVSGPLDALTGFEPLWRARGRRTRRLRVSHAFHSPRLLGPMLPGLAAVARELTPGQLRIPVVSNLTGRPLDAHTLASPDYWVRHAEQPVRFLDGVRALEAMGVTAFAEIGPGGVLTAMARDCLAAPSAALLTPTLDAHRPEPRALLGALAELHTRGAAGDLAGLSDPAAARRVTLPTYAFRRRRFWLDAAPPPATAARTAAAPEAPAAPEALQAPVAAEAPGTEEPADAPRDMLGLVTAEAAAILGYDPGEAVDPDRTLLELGIDSMGAVRLQQRLTARTGLDLPPTLLVDHPTPAALAAHLRTLLGQEAPGEPTAPHPRPAGGGGTFTELLRAAHARGELAGALPLLTAAAAYRPAFTDPAQLPEPPAAVLVSDGPAAPAVVCVPSFLAGSGPHQFARLAAAFEPRLRMSALTLPGYGGPGGPPPPATWRAAIDALAAGALAAAEGQPLLLAGHSIGGVLAHAVAATLERAGHRVAGVVLIDTYEPDPAQRAEVFGWAMGHILARDHAYIDVNDDNVLAMGGYLRLFDGRATGADGRLDAPALLLAAARRPDAPGAGRWTLWRAADTVESVPGDHFSLLEDDAAPTARTVEDWLRKETPCDPWD
ncbi:alpha/beta fold hydrolase, partial [Streptomyces sp. URMC 129]|uniref:alpha/beta fold hydrolase n=1 Tax=Streptomyces sp. URMC 129 TaxID=3423407 RepID=UPI003F19EFFF